jgi:protein-disulfide isomerase
MKRTTIFALVAAAILVGLTVFIVSMKDDGVALIEETGGASTPATAEARTPAPSAGPGVSMDELLAPGALPDQVLGNANAPVTVVEYASLSCSHCREFHDKTFPEVQKRLIDTGKIRFIYRDFPLDQYATAGAMLARCSEGKYFPIVDAFFAQQDGLLSSGENAFKWLQDFAKQVGFTQETMEACLSNQGLMDNILAVRQRASEKFGVSSTPTFFFNGKIKRGALTIEEFEAELATLPKN